MDPRLLRQPPLADHDPEGVDGLFGEDAVDDIIRIVRDVNASAGVSSSAAG